MILRIVDHKRITGIQDKLDQCYSELRIEFYLELNKNN